MSTISIFLRWLPQGRIARTILYTLAALIGLLLIGIGALALTFTRATLETPSVDVGMLPPASPPREMSIAAIATGTYENPAMLAYRGGTMSDVRQFAATALLIRHPKGNLLVDTGFGRNVDAQMKLLPSIQQSPHHKKATVKDALAAGGIGPTELAGIIPTHAHWDHVSGVEDLKGVPILVNAPGKTFIDSAGKGTEVLNSFPGLTYRQYAFEGGPYLGFPRSHDVWGDGSVVIVPAPGHTPDSVIVFVALPSGKRFALLGDLVWQLEGLRIPAEKPWMMRWLIGEDRRETNLDIARIRAAVARYPQLRPVPAHDLRAFAAIANFPQGTR